MKTIGPCAWLAVVLSAGAPASPAERVGDIEFFGYKGIDIAAVRKAVPVHEGDEYSEGMKESIRVAVAAATGKEATDVAAICCDEQQRRLFFIGIAGSSYKPFTYNPEPNGSARLSAEAMGLYGRLDQGIRAAVRKGGDAAQEDDSKGYALIKDPEARAVQLEERRYAIQHEREIYAVLESSSDAQHRQVASELLGYAKQSRRQILALVRAARDRDDEVRNNATRALGVLVRSNARLAHEIPPDTFVEMIRSGVWTDRNKAAALLESLTETRNPALLAKLRASALDALIEMSTWRRPGHAFHARLILGRIAGLPEERLKELAWNGPVEVIVQTARQ